MRRMLVVATLVATAGMTSVGMASAHAAPSTKKFCNTHWKINTVFSSIQEDPKPAEIVKIEKKVAPLLDDADASAPAEIQSQVTTATTALRQGLETAFEDPTVGEAATAIDAWAADNCDLQVVDVTATEYHFDGIPKNLDPGRTVFRLTNEGAELHELGLGRIKTKTPLKALLADEKRAEKEVEQLGGTFAVQGETGYSFVALKKGRWAAVCFVPVGSVDPETEVEGPPHAAEGMVQEFKVS